MKRVLTSVLAGVMLFICTPAFSQYYYQPFAEYGELRRDGADLLMNGQELGDFAIRSVMGEQLWQETFSGARAQYKAGKVIMNIGIPVTASGVGCLMASAAFWAMSRQVKQEWSNAVRGAFTLYSLYFFTYGWVLSGTGLILLSVGVPLRVVGSCRMNWVVDEANKNNGFAMQQPKVNFGLQQYGVGVALRF